MYKHRAYLLITWHAHEIMAKALIGSDAMVFLGGLHIIVSVALIHRIIFCFHIVCYLLGCHFTLIKIIHQTHVFAIYPFSVFSH